MTILLDTGFLLALHNPRDPLHARAKELSDSIMRGQHGRPLISDYIAAEALNYAVRRAWPREAISRLLRELLGRSDEPWMDLLKIDLEIFEAATAIFEGIGLDKGLSFTDCSSIALAKAMRTSLIASFDGGFDGLLSRLS